MWKKFDRITIAVPEIETARQWMVCLLGRTPSWSGTSPQDETKNVIFRLDNTDIELLAPSTEGPQNEELRRRIEKEGCHIDSLSLLTDDAQATVEILRRRGVTADSPTLRLNQDGPSGAFRRWKQFSIPRSAAGGIQLFGVEDLSLPDEMPPSPPVASEESACHAVDHVVVFSQALERAKRFYAETLGIRLALDRSFEDRKLRILFFRIGGLTLEIGAPSHEQSAAEKGKADRLWGLAYQVGDANLAHARMQSEGIGIGEIRNGFKPGTRVFSVKDGAVGLPALMIEPASRSGR